MRRLLALCLIILAGSPVLIKTGVLAWYFWNKSEIAARWCINRNQPELRCGGKCYLSKQLKKAEQTTPAPAPIRPAKLWEKIEAPTFLPPAMPVPAGAVSADAGARRAAFAPVFFSTLSVFLPVLKPPG